MRRCLNGLSNTVVRLYQCVPLLVRTLVLAKFQLNLVCILAQIYTELYSYRIAIFIISQF